MRSITAGSFFLKNQMSKTSFRTRVKIRTYEKKIQPIKSLNILNFGSVERYYQSGEAGLTFRKSFFFVTEKTGAF